MWTVNLASTEASVRRQQRTRPRLFRRYEDLINRPDIDAIIIATPDFAHTPILIDAVRAGKNVFCEKPMATVLAQASEAVDVVHAGNAIIGIGNQHRSDPRHKAAEWFQDQPARHHQRNRNRVARQRPALAPAVRQYPRRRHRLAAIPDVSAAGAVPR